MKQERFEFNDAVLKRARTLKAGHFLTWKKIAEILDCLERSLRTTLSLDRHGKRQGYVEARIRERGERVDEIVAGKKPPEMARKRGITRQAVGSCLRKMGLDEEVRKELLRDF